MIEMKPLREANVLIVDDVEENIDILVEALADDYELFVALDGRRALEIMEETPIDLVLLDVMMPEMDGFEVCERMKLGAHTSHIPVIFITALADLNSKTRAFRTGAVDYVTKPFEMMEVLARVKTHLELKFAKERLQEQNLVLEHAVRERVKEIELVKEATITSLASLAETRDSETGAHIHRTQHYVKVLANYLKTTEKYARIITDDYVELIYKTSPLHDIGKVGVPDMILKKPAKLTDEEFEEMKKHTLYGWQALERAKQQYEQSSFLAFAQEIAYTHHEKWDGTGYPRGLKGEEIPLSGRIMALADVYDALISKRIYKDAFSHEEAKSIIIDGRDSHFDPDIVDAFLATEQQFLAVVSQFKYLE